MEGIYERLESSFPVYVFPDADELGLDGRGQWGQGVVLLRRVPVYDQLYLRLRIPTISLPVVLATYILPSLPSMPVPARLTTLAFVVGLQDRPDFDQAQVAQLTASLRDSAFVSDGSSPLLRKVSDFYDDEVGLFRATLPPERFLPLAFRCPDIPTTFYRKLGLRTVPQSHRVDRSGDAAGVGKLARPLRLRPPMPAPLHGAG